MSVRVECILNISYDWRWWFKGGDSNFEVTFSHFLFKDATNKTTTLHKILTFKFCQINLNIKITS